MHEIQSDMLFIDDRYFNFIDLIKLDEKKPQLIEMLKKKYA